MGRKESAKGIHSSPEDVGGNILLDSYTKDGEEDELLVNILDGYREAQKRKQAYKGLWTEETFVDAVVKYFQFCADRKLKPNKAGLRTWMGCSRSQYYDWTTKVEKYTYKSDILEMAHNMMEDSYVNRGEKYPTMNTFLLKTAHGHVETSKLDLTSNGNTLNSSEDVKDAVSKLGLDK